MSLVGLSSAANAKLHKTQRRLEKPKPACVKFLSSKNINYYKVIEFGKSIRFYDGHKSFISFRDAEILPYSQDQRLLKVALLEVAPDAVMVTSIKNKTVFVFDYRYITKDYILHEYLHAYLKKDDWELARYLDLKIDQHPSYVISDALKKFCK